MDVISYRGPGAAGGVSSGLASAWRNNKTAARSRWWFLADHSISILSSSGGKAEFVTQLAEEIVKGHYRYCNDFLWPLFHDLPQYASYNDDDHSRYQLLNARFASFASFDNNGSNPFFIQDYQLALLPRLLSMHGLKSTVFWHIPWPKNVPAQHCEALAEIARGLLSSDVLGFHTVEYVQNFMRFVADNLVEFAVDFEQGVIRPRASEAAATPIEKAFTQNQSAYVLRPYARAVARTAQGATRLVAKPLGIDVERWQELASCENVESFKDKLPAGVLDLPFVLSVDRADYTKAVIERLKVIDQLFASRPEHLGRLSFLQICGRSRSGLAAFDAYWNNCQTLAHQINNRWRQGNWEPIRWVEQPLNPAELSALYRRADAMLVNPVRDGLNLTAKEFVACQGKKSGALLLSPGAGAWHEIGNYALPAHPHQPEQILDSLARALTMPAVESRARNVLARLKLEKFSLHNWWRYFDRVSRATGVAAFEDEAQENIKTA